MSTAPIQSPYLPGSHPISAIQICFQNFLLAILARGLFSIIYLSLSAPKTPTKRASSGILFGGFSCLGLELLIARRKASKMVSVVSRQGRHRQMYDNGRRVVVGCIPYELKVDKHGGKSLEVLVISSQKGQGILFPKGGWESDETMQESAIREAFEEAGVKGKIEDKLGKWRYISRRYGSVYEGIMFPLNVTGVDAQWPENDVRKRKWVTVAEAKEGCRHSWMKEALDSLVRRLSVSEKLDIASE